MIITTNKKHTLYKKIITSLISIIITYTNIGYAWSSAAVPNINYLERINKNSQVMVTDLLNNQFVVTFILQKSVGVPNTTEFEIIDAENIAHTGRIIPRDEVCNTYGVNNAEDYYRCYVTGQFENLSDTSYKNLSFKVFNQNKEAIKTITERMPELAVTLKTSNQSNDDTYDLLELTNTCAEPIIITQIKGGEYLEVTPPSEPVTIDPYASYKIKLNLNQHAMENASSLSDIIVIEYKIGNETLKNNIGLSLELRDYPKNQHGDNNPELTLSNTLALTSQYKFNSESQAATIQNAQYIIKNNSNKNIPITISGFAEPIYRDEAIPLSLGKNCGDILPAGESCIVKLLIYPAQAGKIKQTLQLASPALPTNITSDINLQVLDDDYPALQITPITNGLPLTNHTTDINHTMPPSLPIATNHQNTFSITDATPSSNNQYPFNLIKSVMEQGQQSLLLIYQLKNNSQASLVITATKINSNAYATAPELVISNPCKILKPQAACIMQVHFTPSSFTTTNISKILKVEFKTAASSSIENAAIPILIKRHGGTYEN